MLDRILIVCWANICRSPMAEGFLKSRYPDKCIQSAGIQAFSDHPADPLSVQVMGNFGIDISLHRSRQLDGALCRDSDLILVMDQSQKRMIVDQYPSVFSKIFPISQWSTGIGIPDPYRKPIFMFEACFHLIKEGLHHWEPYLLGYSQPQQQ
jgi:protein-tyrosine phosphatase